MRSIAIIVIGLMGPGGTVSGTVPTAGAMVHAERGPEVDLRPKFKKGDEIRFTMNLDTAGRQVTPGAGDQSTSTTQQIGLLLRVKDSNPETGATLDLVYESFKMNVKAATGDVSFDSTKPANKDDVSDELLRSIVGLTLNVKVNPDGEITEVSGGDGAGAAAGLASQFTGADMIKGVFGPVFSVKKGKSKAAVGESWTTEDVLQGGAAATRVKMTHTLKSVQGNNANIDIKGSVIIDPSSSGMKAGVKDSTIGGRAVWDIERGMLSRLETDQKLTVETKTDQGSSLSTQTMNLKVVRKN
ncbi:MAG: DUF6263 family protein [Phycisphaerales bacterium]|jgi:hypothetical protein